jgi:rubrerythrin
MSNSLRSLRAERGLDQTLQNLLRALLLKLEARGRYRVFEFEASQDGHPEIADTFRSLRNAEAEQIAALMASLQRELASFETPRAAE